MKKYISPNGDDVRARGYLRFRSEGGRRRECRRGRPRAARRTHARRQPRAAARSASLLLERPRRPTGGGSVNRHPTAHTGCGSRCAMPAARSCPTSSSSSIRGHRCSRPRSPTSTRSICCSGKPGTVTVNVIGASAARRALIDVYSVRGARAAPRPVATFAATRGETTGEWRLTVGEFRGRDKDPCFGRLITKGRARPAPPGRYVLSPAPATPPATRASAAVACRRTAATAARRCDATRIRDPAGAVAGRAGRGGQPDRESAGRWVSLPAAYGRRRNRRRRQRSRVDAQPARAGLGHRRTAHVDPHREAARRPAAGARRRRRSRSVAGTRRAICWSCSPRCHGRRRTRSTPTAMVSPTTSRAPRGNSASPPAARWRAAGCRAASPPARPRCSVTSTRLRRSTPRRAPRPISRSPLRPNSARTRPGHRLRRRRTLDHSAARIGTETVRSGWRPRGLLRP